MTDTNAQCGWYWADRPTRRTVIFAASSCFLAITILSIYGAWASWFFLPTPAQVIRSQASSEDPKGCTPTDVSSSNQIVVYFYESPWTCLFLKDYVGSIEVEDGSVISGGNGTPQFEYSLSAGGPTASPGPCFACSVGLSLYLNISRLPNSTAFSALAVLNRGTKPQCIIFDTAVAALDKRRFRDYIVIFLVLASIFSVTIVPAFGYLIYAAFSFGLSPPQEPPSSDSVELAVTIISAGASVEEAPQDVELEVVPLDLD